MSSQQSDRVWFFTQKDRLQVNLNLFDLSQIFSLVKSLPIVWEIKFDLSQSAPTFKLQTKKQIEYWNFFKEYDDFYSKYCDLKILSLKYKKNLNFAEIYSNFENFSNYSSVLFSACLYQMYPLYKLIKIKRPIYFESANVLTDIFIGKQTIEFPKGNFYLEEIHLVHLLDKFKNYDLIPGPIDPIDFWTLFVFSLYSNPLEHYMYKNLIIRWHYEKSVPMPDLCIINITFETTKLLLKFFSLFIRYFYNNNYIWTRSLDPIKACWELKIPNSNKIISRETFEQIKIEEFFDNKRLEVRPTLKLFPGILLKFEYSERNNQKFRKTLLCLFYKTNIEHKNLNLKFLYKKLFEIRTNLGLEENLEEVSIIRELGSGQFKICIELDNFENFDNLDFDIFKSITTISKEQLDERIRNFKIEIECKINFELYFGDHLTEIREFKIFFFDFSGNFSQSAETFLNSLHFQLFPLHGEIFFKTLNCEKGVETEMSRIISQQKFSSITCQNETFKPKWMCHMSGDSVLDYYLEYYLGLKQSSLNKSKLDNGIWADRLGIKNFTFEFEVIKKDYFGQKRTRIEDLLDETMIIEYGSKYFLKNDNMNLVDNSKSNNKNVSNYKNQIFFSILRLAGIMNFNYLTDDMYGKIEPKINQNITSLDHFFGSNIYLKRTTIPGKPHNRDIKNVFCITATQNLNIEYANYVPDESGNFCDYSFYFSFQNQNKFQISKPKMNSTLRVFLVPYPDKHEDRKPCITTTFSKKSYGDEIDWHERFQIRFGELEVFPKIGDFSYAIRKFDLDKPSKYQELHDEEKLSNHQRLFEMENNKDFNIIDRVYEYKESDEPDASDLLFIQNNHINIYEYAKKNKLKIKVITYIHLKTESKKTIAHLYFEVDEFAYSFEPKQKVFNHPEKMTNKDDD